MALITGTSGNDFAHPNDGAAPPAGYNDLPQATNGGDIFTSGGGGNDIARLGLGNDRFTFGSDLNGADKLDGGSGDDELRIEDAVNATFASDSLASIERILLANTGAAGQRRLVLNDANIATGDSLEIDAGSLSAARRLVLDYSAETDAQAVHVIAGAGNDVVTGRQLNAFPDVIDFTAGGSDTFIGRGHVNFGATYDPTDRVDGFLSARLNIEGDYSAGLTITNDMFHNVDALDLGPQEPTANPTFDYHITFAADAVGPNLSHVNMYTGYQHAGSKTFVDLSADPTHGIVLSGGVGDDTILGGGGGDIVSGFVLNGNQSDRFEGNGGDDLLFISGPMDGDDFADGGAGSDTFGFSGATPLVYDGVALRNFEFVRTSFGTLIVEDAAVAAGKNLTIDGTFNTSPALALVLDATAETDGHIVATAGAGADWLRGGAGSDNLSGGANNDTLDGGAGADVLAGGAGNDTYVYAGADTIKEAGNQGVDTVLSETTVTLAANLERLTLTGGSLANGTGNAIANTITGNGARNLLSGLDGDDTLAGGGDNDTLSGGSGTDQLNGGGGDDTYINPTGDTIVDSAGSDTVQSNVTFSLAGLPAIEHLTLTGSGNTQGNGNAVDNRILGNTGDNAINGLGGADTLQGGDGNDTLNGADGADDLTGGLGADRIAPGPDGFTDILHYLAVGQSTGADRDLVVALDLNAEDKIDLPSVPLAVAAAINGGALNEATFDSDLAAVVTAGALPVGSAVLFNPGSGTANYANTVYLIVDANGVAGYQTGGDYVIQLQGAAGTLDLTDFI